MIYFLTLSQHVGGPVSIIVSTLVRSPSPLRLPSSHQQGLRSQPPVLINRFMLNLRQAGSDSNSSDSANPDNSVVSTPRFQLSDRIVGSMGGSLEHGGSAVHGEDDYGVCGNDTEEERCSFQREERRESQEYSANGGGSGVVSV